MTTVTKYCLSFKLAPAALKSNILEGSANNVVICPAAIGIKRCDRENGIITRAGFAVLKSAEYTHICVWNLEESLASFLLSSQSLQLPFWNVDFPEKTQVWQVCGLWRACESGFLLWHDNQQCWLREATFISAYPRLPGAFIGFELFLHP